MENPKPIVENSSEFPDVSIIEKTPDHSSRDCENKNGDTDNIIFRHLKDLVIASLYQKVLK